MHVHSIDCYPKDHFILVATAKKYMKENNAETFPRSVSTKRSKFLMTLLIFLYLFSVILAYNFDPTLKIFRYFFRVKEKLFDLVHKK